MVLGLSDTGGLLHGPSPAAVAQGRRAVAAAWGAPVLPVLGVATGQLYELGLETENFVNCAMSKDFKKGVTAFVEKQKPDFTGE